MRACDSPTPRFGGKYCSGNQQRFQVCELAPCSTFRNSVIYLYTLLGCCLSVCIQLTSTQLNRSGPNFVWYLTFLYGMIIDAQNNNNLCPKVLNFCKFLKMHAQILLNLRTLFLITILFCTKRRCS